MTSDEEQRRGCTPDAVEKLTGQESNARSEYQWHVEDKVALGAYLDSLRPPLAGAAALWRSALCTGDDDLSTALGMILVRLSRLEREVRP